MNDSQQASLFAPESPFHRPASRISPASEPKDAQEARQVLEQELKRLDTLDAVVGMRLRSALRVIEREAITTSSSSAPDICRSHHKGNPESEAANLTGNKAEMRRQVFAWFVGRGRLGGTADECAAALDTFHNAVAPRITELKVSGDLEQLLVNGKRVRRDTRAGGKAAVLVVVERPR